MHHDFADLAARLRLPVEHDIEQLGRRLSEMIGAPVELRRVPAAPGRACGRSFVTWTGRRVIEYTEHVNPLRERHNVLHEVGHFLIGDLDVTAAHPGLRRFTLLDPEAVARAFQRDPGAYRASSEQTAEAFATYADALIHRTGLEPGASGDQAALLADHRTLTPMWSLVTAACPSVVLTLDDPAEAALRQDAGFALARCYTEIVDTLDVLSRRYNADLAARAAQPGAHNGFSVPSEVAVYAAVIVQAARDEIADAPLPTTLMPRHKPQAGACWQAMLAVAREVALITGGGIAA